jgi:hypothetical protein
MKEVDKTFDPVRLAWLRAVLEDEGIEVFVFDTAAGAIWPGALPARLMVADKDHWRAERALKLAEGE